MTTSYQPLRSRRSLRKLDRRAAFDHRNLNRLFGFQMGEMVVRRFNQSGAEYYQETRKKILAAMLAGRKAKFVEPESAFCAPHRTQHSSKAYAVSPYASNCASNRGPTGAREYSQKPSISYS